MVLHFRVTPYVTKTLNLMEGLSLICSLFTIYTGLYYLTGKTYHYMDQESLKFTLLFCLVIPNLLFFGFWLRSMRLALLDMSFDRSPLLFKCLSLGMIKSSEFKDRRR